MEALEKSLWLGPVLRVPFIFGPILEVMGPLASTPIRAGPGKNDWCEILDENPFWHDPRPGRQA